MADLTLTTNLQQCGGNEYSNTLYTAVYMNIVSQNASTGVTTLHIQIAGWAANTAGGGSTRHWSGVFRMYKGTSGDVALIDGSFGPADYANYTSPVWVINQNYTIQHTRSGGTWQAIKSYGVNVAWVTQKNGTVTHGHRWTTQGYSNCIIPAFNVTSYTVKYNGNGNNGGTVPGNQTKYHNVALTLATNNLTHANSAATANGYKVTFNANGGSSTPAAITQTTYTIYTKNGWNTNSAGTGTHYNNGASYTGNAALTLYAQWSTSTGRNAITLPAAISRDNGSTTGYKVTFNANGGSSTPAAITSTRTVKYAFGGWNTNSSGTGSNYGAGTSYTPSAAITLYAKWTSSYVNNSITLPAAISRTGYTFGGWNTNSSGTGTNYSASSSYTPSAAITLYAKWTPINGKVYYHHGTAYGTVSSPQAGCYYGSPKSGYSLVSVGNQPGFVASGGTAISFNWNVTSTAVDMYNTTTLLDPPNTCVHAAESKQWKVWNATKGKWLNTTGVSAASWNINALVGTNLSYGDTIYVFANWQRICCKIYYNNTWHNAKPWIYYNGKWHEAAPWTYHDEAWHKGASFQP